MIHERSAPTLIEADISPAATERTIRVQSMPLWRKSELAVGVIRAALWHHRSGVGRLPIVHRDVLIREARGEVHLGHLCEIHDRVVLSAIASENGPRAALTIGALSSIWYGTVISARSEITIGRQCAISWNCTILDDDMHEMQELADTQTGPRGPRPVRIADHVWIGASAIVLKGTTIGEGSVVAAGSVVTRDVPPFTLVAGAPARTIRRIGGWK